MRFGWSCAAKSFIETKIVHLPSLFLTQDTLFHYLDSCCKIPNISFADLFSIYIFLLIRSSVDDDDDECEYIFSAQYTEAPSTCIRIFFNLFSGFKNFHVHTYPYLSLELWQHPLGNQTKMQRVRAKQLS